LSDLLRFLEAKTKNTTAARAIVPIATPTPIPAFAPVLSVFDSEGSEVQALNPVTLFSRAGNSAVVWDSQ
jgi:hypothetical protein